MPRGVIDIEGIQSPEMETLKNQQTPDLSFNITKIGHVVLRCQNIKKFSFTAVILMFLKNTLDNCSCYWSGFSLILV